VGTLGALSWTAVGTAPLLAVPVGATEQHGPHLPLDTDTRIATAVAEGFAARRPGVLVAPAIPYSSSGEHTGFPGTLSIGQDATETVLVELGRSADFAAGVVLVCWHGGNGGPLNRATALLTSEGRRVLCWTPRRAGGDAHAGRTETSLMLALAPELVRLDRAAPGNLRPLGELAPRLLREGVRAVAPNGVLGDPAGASAAEGRELLAGLVADLRAAVDVWRV
jgi:creatinine amidohydrolase